MQFTFKSFVQNTTFLLGTFIVLSACNNNTQEPLAANDPILDSVQNRLLVVPAVQPPIPGLDVPFTTYKVAVDEGETFTTRTGTKVQIPANAFVDAQGRAIEGIVEIKFREFHRAGDLIASGIVMHDAASGDYMETGGMFEIEGLQNGKEIFVESSKEIKVDLASYNPGDDFNFFELDQKKCHWDDQGKAAKETPNVERKKSIALINKSMPKRPVRPINRKKLLKGQYFELDVNYQKFPLLKAFSDVVWTYSGEGVDIEKEAWVFETDWDKIDLEDSGKGSYELKLSNGDKTVSTFVQPVLAGKDYEKSLEKFNDKIMKNYQAIKKELEDKRKALNFQAEVRRSFGINGFGVFNCDKWRRIPSLSFMPEIAFDEQSGLNETSQKEVLYYMIMNAGKSVIPFKNSGKNRFRMPKYGKKAMVALLPKGRVAVYTSKEFETIQSNHLENTDRVPMVLHTVEESINSPDDLSMVIDYAMNH